jgi:hypothetical protein
MASLVCYKNHQDVIDFLNQNRSCDVTYRDGEYFIISIQDNSVDIVKALLEHFKEYQLGPLKKDFELYEETQDIKYQENYAKYVMLFQNMRDILEIAIEDVDLSEDMKTALSEYLDFGDGCDDDFSLDVLDQASSDSCACTQDHDYHTSSDVSLSSNEYKRDSEESTDANDEGNSLAGRYPAELTEDMISH